MQIASSAKSSFSTSLAAILAGQFASGAIALVLEISYARLLGASLRGVVSLCAMLVAFGVLVGAAGGEGSIIFWSSKEKGNYRKWLPAVLAWGLAGCVVASTLWFVAYWGLRLSFLKGVSSTLSWLVLANIPAAVLFAYSMSLLAGSERFALRSANVLARQLAGFAGFLLLVLLVGKTPEAALTGTLVGYLAASFATIVQFRRELGGFWRVSSAANNLLPTLSYGLRGQIGNVATFFTYRLDVFVINYFLPLAQLGYYALGVTVSEVLWQLPSAAASALFPRTARSEVGSSREFTCMVIRNILLMTVVCGALMAITCPLLIPLVFGASFRPSVAVILWLLPGTMALSLAKVGCSDLAGRGKNGYSSIFAIVCLALTVVLDFLFIPRWGILGAAAASSLAYLLDTLLVLAVLRYELRVSWRTLLIPYGGDFLAYRSALRRLISFVSPPSVRGRWPVQRVFSAKGD